MSQVGVSVNPLTHSYLPAADVKILCNVSLHLDIIPPFGGHSQRT